MVEEEPGFRKMDSFWACGAVNALKAIAFVCDIVTYPIYLFLQKPWEKKSLSNRVKAKPVAADDKSITFRNVGNPREMHQLLLRENIDTMEKVLKFAVSRYPNKNSLGTRDILAEEDEKQSGGRVFKKYVMGEYKWRTYTDVDKEATKFGKGLRELGIKPKQPVAIFAETRAEWMIAAQACFKQNIPVVTIYATLGEDGIEHAINETEVSLVITSHELLPKFRNLLKHIPKVKTLVYMTDQLFPTDTSNFENVTLVSYPEVVNKGTSSKLVAEPPTSKDTIIIMYTSGSTGVPKGVIITHTNMITTLKAFSDCVDIYPTDIFLGYLPLAHVFELLVESVCLLWGVSIGYSTPLTMIDTSSKIKRGTKGDASVLKPTILTAVPLILDRIYKGIQDKVNSSPLIRKVLFTFAYNYKLTWSHRGFDTPLINTLIFRQTAALLGGKLRLILSGGAPLSPDTHDLTKICLGVQVIQGYGLTESTSAASVMDEFDRSTGRVGAPVQGCDIRLVNWEEGNYTVKDKPYPRGEIILGGNNIANGYFKLLDKTKEDFFEEDGRRWFRTGDIAEVHPDGSFKIIDRKKDLVKLQAGEYVSLGKVEAELKTCPVVENICIYGDSSKLFTVALVVPNPTHLRTLTNARDEAVTFEELCKLPDAEKAVLLELQNHAKKCKLEKFEIPAAVKLCSEVWSPDMGLVTAAFKLKRKDIQARYQTEINRMYAS